MLDKVKNALRIDGADHDDELMGLIATATALLREVGVNNSRLVVTDNLVRLAVIQYCKAMFGTDPKDSEKYMNVFEEMKQFMSLNSNYTGVDDS